MRGPGELLKEVLFMLERALWAFGGRQQRASYFPGFPGVRFSRETGTFCCMPRRAQCA